MNNFYSEYDNRDKYKFIGEEYFYEINKTIIIQYLENKETKQKIKRTLKIPDKLSKTQVENVLGRRQLPKFGEAKKDKEYSNNEENVFMEYNPEIFKSKKSKKTLENMLINKFNQEKIKVSEENKKNFDNLVLNLYDNLKKNSELDKKVLQNNLKFILDYKNNNLPNNNLKDKNIENDNSIKNNTQKNYNSIKNIVNLSGGYVPPHLRKKRESNNSSNTSNNNTNESKKDSSNYKKYKVDEEKKVLRLSNIPEELNENHVLDWLYTFNIKKVRVYIPKCKRTNKSRDYCFINFQSKYEAEKALTTLHKQKFDYCLVNVEYSTPRN